ncbi:MAG: thiamine pyrophosphate-binding protein [Rubrivivax sp.]
MNLTHPIRGCDALVQTLQAAGVPRLFTLSGNHVMPVFDAAFGAGLPLVHTRHEAAAVHMADAQSRTSGCVGVALVTGGPGHANAVGALYTTLMAEAPLLLLSGHAPQDQLASGAFQEMDQVQMAAPVCKAAWVCRSADTLATDVARAIRIARSGRPGPVHLSLPTDVLEALTAAPLPTPVDFEPDPLPLSDADADALLQPLLRAQRPLVLVGPAAMTRSGRALQAALQAASGVPVFGMESPRGIGDGSLGAFGALLAASDCVLLVGKRLDFTLKFGQAPAFPVTATVLQVDAEGAEIERSRRAVGGRLTVTAQADAGSALQGLARVAEAGSRRGPSDWLAQAESARAYRPAAWADAHSSLPGRLHPVQMLHPLQALLDSHSDAVLVCDGGEIGQWATACLQAPHRVINGVAGSIGSGLPYAIGAACTLPGAPVVAVMGDGTVGFHIAEFDTAVRHGLPLLVVVGNDARWNAEYQIQLRDYGAQRRVGCELLPTRYDAVAAAFGAHGALVDAPQAMSAAIRSAVDSGSPACLNVMIEGLPAPLVRQ